jgi:hypothetical protein
LSAAAFYYWCGKDSTFLLFGLVLLPQATQSVVMLYNGQGVTEPLLKRTPLWSCTLLCACGHENIGWHEHSVTPSGLVVSVS